MLGNLIVAQIRQDIHLLLCGPKVRLLNNITSNNIHTSVNKIYNYFLIIHLKFTLTSATPAFNDIYLSVCKCVLQQYIAVFILQTLIFVLFVLCISRKCSRAKYLRLR